LSTGYVKGIAFIMEGATEKVFYRAFLQWLADKHGCRFERIDSTDIGEILFEWTRGTEVALIKFNVVGAVTQVVHSVKWFRNTCSKKYKIPWNVYLCYDTDSPGNDISKFFEDDWKLLRADLRKAKAKSVVDLAAQADIEDVMLCDLPGICRYLGVTPPERLIGRKGKAKMKALYRSCGRTYHAGEKSEDMVKKLDFEKIIKDGPIRLDILVGELTKIVASTANKVDPGYIE